MAASRRVRLSVSQLENREVPALMSFGGGTFSGSSGAVNLNITFTGANAISWSTAPPTTPAIFASGAATVGNLTVNLTGCGQTTAGLVGGNIIVIDMAGFTLTGNLTILTGACDDVVTIYNGTVNGQVSIKTQGGNDNVTLGAQGTSLNFTQSLVLNEAGGDDTIGFFGSSLGIGVNANMALGAGNNSYFLGSQFKVGNNLNIAAGAGSDPINQLGVAGSSVGGNATFLPGGGNNSLLLPAGLTIGGNVIYSGGAGKDAVYDDANILGNLWVSLGGDDDRFTYGFVPFVGGSAKIFGGPQFVADTYTQLSVPGWPNTVTGFP